jgi:hypothetical protein
MTENSEKLLDDVGWQLLGLLQEHARLSFKELGRYSATRRWIIRTLLPLA